MIDSEISTFIKLFCNQRSHLAYTCFYNYIVEVTWKNLYTYAYLYIVNGKKVVQVSDSCSQEKYERSYQ